MKMFLRALMGILVLTFSIQAVVRALPQHPNIILLLSDDQDWNGLSTRMHPDMPIV
jgi:hypothetical protein